MKFVFTCGGTAGHINPALAVAAKLRELLPSCEVLFIGAEDRMEMELVPNEGYPIEGLKISDISREKSISGFCHNVRTVFLVISSFFRARKILKKFRPDAVIGTGGYICFPVLMAGRSLKIPTLVHESNASPGLTTKLLARYVDRIMVGLEGCEREYPCSEKVVVTGTPVRGSFSNYTRESARLEMGIDRDEKLVVSLWGSLGAGVMNGIVTDMIPLLRDSGIRFVHSTGNGYYQDCIDRLSTVCPDYGDFNVEVRSYIRDTPRVMQAADLVLCRAGASTLSELSFIGKPAILVPSPNVTDNHQEKNARVFERCGGAVVMLEEGLTAESLLSQMNSIIGDDEKLREMSLNMASLKKDDATDSIVNLIFELTKR